MEQKNVLAVDLGASSGRVMRGAYDGKTIALEEIHRFSNDPVSLNGTVYWDFLRLFFEVKRGMNLAGRSGGFDSIAVDTWGVDFGLLDEGGNLLENPVHYRDGRTAGMLQKSFEKIEKQRFYRITGNQFMEINTAFQLLSLAEHRESLLNRASALLLMPDLFHYFLCGRSVSEYTIASTTQLLDAVKKGWSREVTDRLGIPARLLQPVVMPGTKLGQLKPELCEELGLKPVQVIAAAGHDTQSALAAVPAPDGDFIFISCGTWSLFGTELNEPVIGSLSERYNWTNEGGCQGKVSFLKNITGLWLVQESRRQWVREGKEYSFSHLEQMAAESRPFRAWIDPDAPEFMPPGDMPARIRAYCARTGQEVPETEGEIVRCIDESLALKYRRSLEEIRECTGKEYPMIHMVGGGIQSELLCRMTADACGCPVTAGPVEATVMGNIALQLMALGEIKDLSQARAIVRASADTRVYEPVDRLKWEEMYRRYRKLMEETIQERKI